MPNLETLDTAQTYHSAAKSKLPWMLKGHVDFICSSLLPWRGSARIFYGNFVFFDCGCGQVLWPSSSAQVSLDKIVKFVYFVPMLVSVKVTDSVCIPEPSTVPRADE